MHLIEADGEREPGPYRLEGGRIVCEEPLCGSAGRRIGQ